MTALLYFRNTRRVRCRIIPVAKWLTLAACEAQDRNAYRESMR
jgi:hypothetical protein